VAKFTKQLGKQTTAPGVIRTTDERTTTHEGGAAWTRTPQSDLFLLAVTNMVGEDTFYEKAGDRDVRFRNLVRQCAVQHPDWTARFIKWLRSEGLMRSASVVAAAEYVHARRDEMGTGRTGTQYPLPTISARSVVRDALQRPDEPGELLAYWTSRYGMALPKPLKRGIADAMIRMGNERNFIKYGDVAHPGFSWRRVLDLTHSGDRDDSAQTIKAPWQHDLFDYVVSKPHEPELDVPESLRILRANRDLMALPVAERRAVLLADGGAQRLNDAGITWEILAGWLQGPMDRAAWEAIIPSMGYMALIRNLRNFDEAKVSDKVAAQVAAKIADPAEVARSRQFPYRFLSAYKAAPSLRWGHALEQALAAATANIPLLDGRTLVLVDTSSSMQSPVSGKSQIRHVDIGALIGVALAYRTGGKVSLYGYADGVFQHDIALGGSMLREIDRFTKRIGEVGHGTQTIGAIEATFKGHDRVIVVTDGQAFAYGGYYSGGYGVRRSGLVAPRATSVSDAVPASVPLFGIDTTGYSKASIDTKQPNRFEVGGFSDAVFKMFAWAAAGRGDRWPWEQDDSPAA
jgi:hypothetical protein